MSSVKGDLLIELDASAGFRMVADHGTDGLTALCWAAKVVALLPEDHSLFWQLAAAHNVNAEGWRLRERALLSRWGRHPGETSGMAFVIELGAVLDKFLSEEE